MICVKVESREGSLAGALAHREWVAAPSIERRLHLLVEGSPAARCASSPPGVA